MLKIMDRSIKKRKCGQNMKQQVMGQTYGRRVESNGEHRELTMTRHRETHHLRGEVQELWSVKEEHIRWCIMW